MPLVSAFVVFAASVEITFLWTGWLYSLFELEYPRYHFLLDARHWQDPLPLVLQNFLIENLHPPQFCQKNPSIPDGQCKNVVNLYQVLSAVSLQIPFLEAYISLSSFIDNVIRKCDIILVGVGI